MRELRRRSQAKSYAEIDEDGNALGNVSDGVSVDDASDGSEDLDQDEEDEDNDDEVSDNEEATDAEDDKPEYDLSEDMKFIVRENFTVPTREAIVEDKAVAKDTAIAEENVIAHQQTPECRAAIEKVTNLINKAMRWLANQSLMKAKSSKVDTFEDDIKDKIPVLYMMPNTEDNRYHCPLFGCDRSFKGQPSFKYHVNNHAHDIMTFLTGIKEIGATVDIEDQKLNNLIELVQSREASDNCTNDFLYRWIEKDWPPTTRDCSFTFTFGKSKPSMRMPATYRERIADNINPTAPMEVTPRPTGNNEVETIDRVVSWKVVVIERYVDAKIHLITSSDIDCPIFQQTVNYKSTSSEEKTVVKPFQSVAIENESAKNGFILNTCGTPVKVAWVPGIGYKEYMYLSVVCQTDLNHHTVLSPLAATSRAFMQIWKFTEQLREDFKKPIESPSVPKLSALYCFESSSGEILDLKWMPGGKLGDRLGVVALTLADGTLLVVPVPTSDTNVNIVSPKVQVLKKTFKVQWDDVMFTSVAWSPWKDDKLYLAAGTEDGGMAVWLVNCSGEFMMVSYAPLHAGLISSLDFLEHPDKTLICSVGFDGIAQVHNIFTPLIRYISNNSLLYGLHCAAWNGGYAWCGTDNIVRWAVCEAELPGSIYGHWIPLLTTVPTKKFAKKDIDADSNDIKISLSGAGDSISAVATSKLHPFLAAGCSNGSVCTSNILNCRHRYQLKDNEERTAQILHKRRLLRNEEPHATVPLYQLQEYACSPVAEVKKTLNLTFNESPTAVKEDVPRTLANVSGPVPMQVQVSSVDWNPNVSSWIASSLRCGIVRVESAIRYKSHNYFVGKKSVIKKEVKKKAKPTRKGKEEKIESDIENIDS